MTLTNLLLIRDKIELAQNAIECRNYKKAEILLNETGYLLDSHLKEEGNIDKNINFLIKRYKEVSSLYDVRNRERGAQGINCSFY